MNEFDTATFALQSTTAQELIVWAPLISAGAAVFAAIGIWGGVIAMTISNSRRSRDTKEMRRANDQRHEEVLRANDQRHEEAMAAHKETMAAHEETMATHKETMAAHKAAHEEAMSAHKEAMAAHEKSMMALQELIRRTSSLGPETPTAAAK